MKKLLGIVVLSLGLLFLFKNPFSIKTYLKCEPYEQNSKEVLYFAFDKRYIWSNYDPVNSEFKDEKRNGQGIYTFANGTVDKGIWKNNKLIEPN